MIILRNKTFSLSPTRVLAGFNKKILRKSGMEAKREAIKTQNKTIGKIASGINTANRVALNPGNAVNEVIEAGIKNPIAVSGNIAGKALMVAPVPTVVKAAPIGGASIAVEAVAKKNPTYKRLTESGARKFHNARKLRNSIEQGTNTLYKMAQNLPM